MNVASTIPPPVRAWTFRLLRWLLGAVFIYAGWIKIIDPHGFALNIYHYQLLSDRAVNLAALLLPWLEVIAGIALIALPTHRRGAAGWILIMLIIFTGAILISLHRGLDISCGCLSTGPDAARIGWRKVIENTGLIALAILAGRDTSRLNIAG